MNDPAFLGLDLGSSSIKAVGLDESGQCVAAAKRTHLIRTGLGGIAEQDPYTWHEIAGQVLRELAQQLQELSLTPAAIAATGQMDGPVLIDQHQQPVTPVQMWCDSRCDVQCQIIEDRIPANQLLAMTGHCAVTGYTAPKLMWIAEHTPQVFQTATHIIFPKDFITLSLTDQIVSDYSDAANSLILDIHQGQWDDAIMELLALPPINFPTLADSTEHIGSISASGAAWSGLPEGTAVATGAGDSIAAALGAGLHDPSMVQIVIGSAGNVNCVLNEPRIDPQGRVHTGYFVDHAHWICTAVQQSAGASLLWWSDITGLEPEQLVNEIDTSNPPTALFAPYLCGERTPHLDSNIRAAFTNLNQHTSRRDMTRAILEGVAFSFKDAFEVLGSMSINPSCAAICGGGGDSKVWQRIIAAVLDVQLIPSTGDTTAKGAAMLAACAAGRFKTWLEAIDSWPEANQRVEAVPTDIDQYQRSYLEFKELYPSLKSFYK